MPPVVGPKCWIGWLLLATAGCAPLPEVEPDPVSRDSSRVPRERESAALTTLEPPEEDPFRQSPSPWWQSTDLARPEVVASKNDLLADDGRGLRTWLRRAEPLLPDMLRILEEAGLPPEIWVLAIVESGLRYDARSRSNAVGLWQFVPNTANHSGLLVTLDRDQRRDWEASTRAASRYLIELKSRFDDGLLALAAFNCGPSRVSREIAGRDEVTFWDLDLPPETRRHVPRVLALADLLGAGDKIDLDSAESDPPRYEVLTLPHPVRVVDLARECNMNTGDLKKLNPSWLRPVTPGDGHPVEARVPLGRKETVLAGFRAGRLPEIKLTPGRVHEIRSGETLWGISRRYSVGLQTLLQLNDMSGKEIIRPGHVIRLPG